MNNYYILVFLICCLRFICIFCFNCLKIAGVSFVSRTFSVFYEYLPMVWRCLCLLFELLSDGALAVLG